jgi:hypothetical protein
MVLPSPEPDKPRADALPANDASASLDIPLFGRVYESAGHQYYLSFDYKNDKTSSQELAAIFDHAESKLGPLPKGGLATGPDGHPYDTLKLFPRFRINENKLSVAFIIRS